MARVRRLAVALLLVVPGIWLAAARPAAAEGPPSAVQQYSEEVPTGSGSKPVTDKKAHVTPPISAGLENLVRARGGKDATALLHVARSKSLGAPHGTESSPGKSAKALQTARASSPSSAAVVADTTGSSHLPWLVAALLAMAVVALVPLAARGRRRR